MATVAILHGGVLADSARMAASSEDLSNMTSETPAHSRIKLSDFFKDEKLRTSCSHVCACVTEEDTLVDADEFSNVDLLVEIMNYRCVTSTLDLSFKAYGEGSLTSLEIADIIASKLGKLSAEYISSLQLRIPADGAIIDAASILQACHTLYTSIFIPYRTPMSLMIEGKKEAVYSWPRHLSASSFSRGAGMQSLISILTGTAPPLFSDKYTLPASQRQKFGFYSSGSRTWHRVIEEGSEAFITKVVDLATPLKSP